MAGVVARLPDIAAVARIEDAARAADGRPSLGEAVWRDLERPGPESAGFLADERAYVHVARSDNFSPRHWAVGTVVAPTARGGDDRARLLADAVRHVAAHGGGRMVLWVFGAGEADDAELQAYGWRRERELHEMRVALPLDAQAHWAQAQWPPGIEVRPFEVGRDEQAWLEVNNRAFGNHPEQGGWIESTLARRMAEPWFDPSLFLLAFDGEGLAGFNWMKVHDAHGRDPRLGEIFVIGVDPRVHGSGLGRALAIAGLDEVARRGITTGSLFVAAENEPALRLYRSLGFTVHRSDRAYERIVDAA